MPRTLQNWDAETHEAVLLALIEHMKPSGSDWSAVVASLRSKGYTFTEGALVYAYRLDENSNRLLYFRLLFLSLFPSASLPTLLRDSPSPLSSHTHTIYCYHHFE